jgi:hypothetical protein
MTAQEKAKELVDKYKNPFNRKGCIPPTETMFDSTAKQCALIAVDELLNNFLSNKTTKYGRERYHFWQQVKQEINKL